MRVILLITALLLSPATFAQSDMVDATKKTLGVWPNCVEYCIVGVSIRAQISVTGLSLFATLHVKHYWSDLLATPSPEIYDSALDDWDRVVGKIQHEFMLMTMPLAFGKLPASGPEGETLRTDDYGAHHLHTFHESQVAGHPLTLVPKILDTDGFDMSKALSDMGPSRAGMGGQPRDGGLIESSGSGLTYQSLLSSLGCSNIMSCVSSYTGIGLYGQYFSMGEVFEWLQSAGAITFFENFVEWFNTNLAEIKDIVGVTYGWDIERIFCKNPVVPALPYYISGADWLFWRSGWPLTDASYSATILNPFSTDIVGNLFRQLGNVYPRHGIVDNIDNEAAAVNVVQALSIIGSNAAVEPRPRVQLGTGGVRYNALYPEITICSADISNVIPQPEVNGKYLWSVWRPYECDLSDDGFRLFTIPIPAVCF